MTRCLPGEITETTYAKEHKDNTKIDATCFSALRWLRDNGAASKKQPLRGLCRCIRCSEWECGA